MPCSHSWLMSVINGWFTKMQKKTISFINWDKRVKKAYELNHLKNWYSIKPSWSRSLGWLNSGFSPFLAMGFCFSFTLVRRIFIIDNSSHLIWNSMFIYGSSAIISTALLGWPPCTHDYRDFMSVLNHSNKYSASTTRSTIVLLGSSRKILCRL